MINKSLSALALVVSKLGEVSKSRGKRAYSLCRAGGGAIAHAGLRTHVCVCANTVDAGDVMFLQDRLPATSSRIVTQS